MIKRFIRKNIRYQIKSLIFLIIWTGVAQSIAVANRNQVDKLQTILTYQRTCGGWPKNYNQGQKLSANEQAKIKAEKEKNDATIDNKATYTEIRVLANGYDEYGNERFRQAALKGINYLLEAQYDHGGWPQKFPYPKGYSQHITFNDNAMIGVMRLLRDIGMGQAPFSFISIELRERCQKAVKRGVDCILTCQIIVNDQLTTWCAQHDAITFEPRPARSYELVSLSGSESVSIVRFLMEIEQPNQVIIAAIESAITWFNEVKLTGIKLVRIADQSRSNGFDRIVIEDHQAAPMWARFYDIKTNQPIYCSRDGIIRNTLSEISHERRTGYSWLGHYAQKLLSEDFPAWQSRLEKINNSK